MKSLKKLTQRLGPNKRKLLSYAIDEIETATYMETRSWFLRRIQKWLDQGRDIQKEIDYMKSKPYPKVKER